VLKSEYFRLSEATGVKNLGKILYFLTDVKLSEYWARYLSEFYQLGNIGSNL